MEATKKQFEKLKNLFSKFLDIQNEINELCTSNVKKADVDLGTKNVTDGNAELKLQAGTNFNENVPHNVHYLSNANSGVNNVTRSCSTPVVLTESNISYENVSHDLSNGSNTNTDSKNVTHGYSTPELITGSNVSGKESYGNIGIRERTETDANHHVMNVTLPNKRTFNERRLEQITNKESHSYSVMNYFYYLFDDNDMPLDNSHPSNGDNEKANANNVNDEGLTPELVTGSNFSDISNGNVPHRVHYLSNGADSGSINVTPELVTEFAVTDISCGNVPDYVNYLSNGANNGVYADSGSTNVTHGYFTPEFVTEFAVSDISYGNACDTLNLDSESPAADLNVNAKMTEKLMETSSRLYHSGSTNVATDTDTVETDVSIEPDIDVTSLNDKSAVQPNLDSFFEKIAIAPRRGCDNSKMFVPKSDGKSKKYCCVYCRKRFSKLVPHLQFAHKNEPNVLEFCNEPPGSIQRRKIIDMIRKKGQDEWNSDEKLNQNEFAVSRRPNKLLTGADYLTCANCYGKYRITVLARHWRKCTNNAFKGVRVVHELGRAIEGRYHADACDDLRTTVFPKMRDTEAVRLIRFDWILVAFGNDLCLKYSPHYQQQLIRTSLRKAGKVLLAAKSIAIEITDFASLYHVKHCNTVIEAIRTVAGFDYKLKEFKSPGTASTLVTLMNAIGEELVIESMKLDDTQKERNAERFLKVFQKDVKGKINKIVAVQQAKARRRRKENIPTTNDVNRLVTYLDRERSKGFIELSQEYSYQKWLCLSELTMISILLFNRRRVGEMQNLTISDFEEREMTNSEAIPVDIKELIKSRMQIRGKLCRTVPALLKHDYEACIELLLLHRQYVGISDKNDCLFALPTKSKNIRTINAGATIKTFSKLCGAENPSSLRATKLRKQMASFCATLNLNDNDITNVSTFMGHDDKIHRDYYRHNTLQREVVQMTILLEGALGIRIVTPNPDITQPAKNQTRKKIIDLSNEISSEEEISDDCTSDEDEPKMNISKTNERVQIKTKTNQKVKENPTVTVAKKRKTQLTKNRKQKIIDLSNEISSEEKVLKANKRVEIIKTKTNQKVEENQTATSNGGRKRKYNPPVQERTKRKTQPAKNQNRKLKIDLSNEISSEEKVSDDSTLDKSERSDDEAKMKFLKANDRDQGTTTKTNQKIENPTGTVVTKGSQKRVGKRTKIDKSC